MRKQIIYGHEIGSSTRTFDRYMCLVKMIYVQGLSKKKKSFYHGYL